MLVGGTGFSYNPKKVQFMKALLEAYELHLGRTGVRPTHVALPKAVTEEEVRMTQQGLGLIVASKRYGCPLIVIGTPMGVEDDIKE